MIETKNETVTDSAQSVTKKVRRGINNQTKAVTQLRFNEKDASPQNMLFIGHLEEVKVTWSTNADGKQFTGMNVPSLIFHFESNHINTNEKRHVYKNISPVESTVLTIPGQADEWKVTNVFNWIKHILDVFYLKGRELTEKEEEALTLPFEDFDENGNYISVDPETVINGYAFIFNNAASMLNGSFELKDKDGEIAKPCYKSADGKIIPCWIKLLRHKKVKNKWINVGQNGELGFDGFIGNGVVELMRRDMPPAILSVDIAKESITPKNVNSAPTFGAPNSNPAIMGGIMAGNPMNMGTMGGTDATSAFSDAGDTMPF